MSLDPSQGVGSGVDAPSADILRRVEHPSAAREPLTPEQLFSLILQKSPSGWTTPHSSQILRRQSLDADLLMAKEAALELFLGLKELSCLKHPVVCVYGGARMNEERAEHAEDVRLTRAVGGEIIRRGFSQINGGGPGAMHYASEGGHAARIKLGAGEDVPSVVGVRIHLPFEKVTSPFLDKVIECKYFFTRKALMAKYSAGVVMAPGGMGSYDEFFEALAIGMAGKEPYPIALLGDYWKPLYDWLKYHPEGPGQRGYISKSVLNQIQLVGNETEAVDWIQSQSKERVARFYSHKANGNHGPLADEIVGDVKLLADPQWNLSDITMVWDALQDMQGMFHFLNGNRMPLVSVIGGLEVQSGDPHQLMAHNLGIALAQRELSTLVPRADGLMLSAAYAAREQGGYAFALDRSRPGRPAPSPGYADDTHVCFTDFTQELGLVKGSVGMVVLPGGVGTMRMFSETQNLIMCRKLGVDDGRYPLVLMGRGFFHPLREVLYEAADTRGYLTRKEIDSMLITDDPAEAVRRICSSTRSQQEIFSRSGRVPLPVMS